MRFTPCLICQYSVNWRQLVLFSIAGLLEQGKHSFYNHVLVAILDTYDQFILSVTTVATCYLCSFGIIISAVQDICFLKHTVILSCFLCCLGFTQSFFFSDKLSAKICLYCTIRTSWPPSILSDVIAARKMCAESYQLL